MMQSGLFSSSILIFKQARAEVAMCGDCLVKAQADLVAIVTD